MNLPRHTQAIAPQPTLPPSVHARKANARKAPLSLGPARTASRTHAPCPPHIVALSHKLGQLKTDWVLRIIGLAFIISGLRRVETAAGRGKFLGQLKTRQRKATFRKPRHNHSYSLSPKIVYL